MGKSFQLAGNASNTLVDTIEPIFVASNGFPVRIEAFTASNTSNVNASYKAYITSPSGTPQAQQPFKVVVWGENDLGLGLINQVIPEGGTLSVESSAINSIYFTVSGVEL